MAKNLRWTSSLGEAYHNEQAEVMTAIQTLRAEAKAKGQPQVHFADDCSSAISSGDRHPTANPQVVYVPEYNPAVIYGSPYVTPGYSAGDVAAAGINRFRSRNRRRGNDERWLLRLGLQQLELRLAWNGRGLSRRSLLR